MESINQTNQEEKVILNEGEIPLNDKQYTFIAKFIYEIFKRIFKD